MNNNEPLTGFAALLSCAKGVNDCTGYYFPSALATTNLVMVLKCVEQQAKTLDIEHTQDLKFGICGTHVGQGQPRLYYLHDDTFVSTVHNYFYERARELQEILTQRHGRLGLITGEIVFSPLDVDKLCPLDVEVEFEKVKPLAREASIHTAYCQKTLMLENITVKGRLETKRVM